MMKHLYLAAAALLALSGPLHAQGMSMPGHSMAPASPDASGSSAGYMDAMHGMNEGMAIKPTGDADRDFAAMMLAHHQGAVAMAKVELRYGKDAKLRRMARTIIAAQEREITVLQAWLSAKAH